MTSLNSIKNVDIDHSGNFKYILVKAINTISNESKLIIRGTSACNYHNDIFDKVKSQARADFDFEVLGGGKIKHEPEERSLHVYGTSTGYGQADHKISAEILKTMYPNYSVTHEKPATNMETVQKLVDFVSGKSTYETSTHVQPMWDETKTMKCLIWNGKNNIEYVEHARPKITESRDILLRVTATTICGSDLHLMKGTIPGMKRGDIPGHEFMGVVEEIGSDVHKLKVGDRVIVAFAIACGECSYCKREEYTACDTTNPTAAMEVIYGHKLAAFYGYSHLTGGVPGGQAEFVRVPFADFNCMVVPDDVPDEKALYMTDIVITGLHGNICADVKEGKTVAVWGLGPVGLMACKWATILGAKTVIGIDCVAERLDLAKDKLAIETINFKQQDVLKRIPELLGSDELDCAIECAGFDYTHSWIHKIETFVGLETDTSEILNQMFKAVRKCGNIGLIGDYSGFANHFNIGAVMEKSLTIKGGQAPGKKYWKFALEKIRDGELDPTFLVTHRGTLADGPNFYRDMCDLKAGVIKVFMRPENYEPKYYEK